MRVRASGGTRAISEISMNKLLIVVMRRQADWPFFRQDLHSHSEKVEHPLVICSTSHRCKGSPLQLIADRNAVLFHLREKHAAALSSLSN